MILLPVDGSRKRGHVLRARNGFAKQDVRHDTDTECKISRYIAPAGLVLSKRRVVETRNTRVTRRAHASIAR